MILPLDKIFIGFTFDSDSFKEIDIATEVEIPTGDHVGAFGTIRKFHTHEGIDLYAQEGDPVYAIEPGMIVNMGWFTGPEADSPWWGSTQFIMVQGDSGVINYGELLCQSDKKVGQLIEEGELLGHVAKVLTTDKGRPMSMLHLELYEHGYYEPVEWRVNTERPYGLLNPLRLFVKP
jgi:murein DD-endopeptidase MepM/ murein hydrolase activator NlpD